MKAVALSFDDLGDEQTVTDLLDTWTPWRSSDFLCYRSGCDRTPEYHRQDTCKRAQYSQRWLFRIEYHDDGSPGNLP